MTIKQPDGSSRSIAKQQEKLLERNRVFQDRHDEHDIIIIIDQTNLALWFGPRTEEVVKLLKLATDVADGWQVHIKATDSQIKSCRI